MLGILYAYLVRFLAPAYQAVDAQLRQDLARRMTLSAMSLGASPRRILARVHLPLVRPGVAVALVLVMIDAIKELPIVLLLRPFGFTTVSVWVYELAAENFWKKAALPALVIVAVATVPVFFLFRQVRLVDPHRRSADVRADLMTQPSRRSPARPTPALVLDDVTKTYGGTVAAALADLTAAPG